VSDPPVLPDPPVTAAGLRPFLGAGAPVDLREHRTTFARPPRPRREADDALIGSVEAAGLRGRGGAAFPTAVKLRAVASGRRRPIVVANGSEGEPASRKDDVILTLGPHLALDGAALAARAVGAEEVIVAVDVRRPKARASIERALEERSGSEPGGVWFRVAEVPPGYVSGEERSLVHLLNRGPAIPTTGPRPFVRGVRGSPTLIQNVETLAHMATIHAFGPSWFRSIGPEYMPGSMMVTVSGGVARPGVYEVEVGSPIREAIAGAGGTSAGVGGVLVGGYAGSWLAPDVAERTTLDPRGLDAAGGILGAGVIIVLPDRACGWSETAAVMRWLSGQTAGQCGPCVYGLAAIAGAAERVAAGRVRNDELGRLTRWASDVEGRGACQMPDGAVRLLRSALDVFADDVRTHVRGHQCRAAGEPRILPTPGARRETAA
jgi:NADH:ubiquinone oxidoreductase subunit F (NADH-binding)